MFEPGEIGEYRHRVTIAAPLANRDPAGQSVNNYLPIFDRWASIEPLRGQQLALAQAKTATATATHTVKLRWFQWSPPDPRWPKIDILRVGFHQIWYPPSTSPAMKPRVLTINAVINPDEARIEWLLTCTEVTS